MASMLRPSSRQAATCTRRAFSTTRSLPVSLQWQDNHPESLADAVPPYPYGPTLWYKQSSKGLYGGQRIRFGNNVSDKFEVKTRRSWHPNVKTKRLFSKALNRHVQVRVTTKVLRTIDKLGGLDEYLLGEKEMRIKELGESGWWLRWAVMQTPVVKRKFAAQREALGLPPVETGPAEESLSEMAEAEAQGTVEAAAQEYENAEGVDAEGIEGEAVEMDDAFEIEQPVELPPLKFRVAPHQHLYLTPTGWKRVREDPSRRLNIEREKLFKKYSDKKKTSAIDDVRRGFNERLKALEEREEKVVQAAAEIDKPTKELARRLRQNLHDRFKDARFDRYRPMLDEDQGTLMSVKLARQAQKASRTKAVQQVEQAISEARSKITRVRSAHIEQQLSEMRKAKALLAAEREKAFGSASKEFNSHARRWAEDSQNERLAEKHLRQQERAEAKKLARSEKRAQEAEQALAM